MREYVYLDNICANERNFSAVGDLLKKKEREKKNTEFHTHDNWVFRGLYINIKDQRNR